MALIAAHLNAGHSGGDSVAIGIYSLSSPPPTPYPSPLSPSLISRTVSVDVMFTYLFHIAQRGQRLSHPDSGRERAVLETGARTEAVMKRTTV